MTNHATQLRWSLVIAASALATAGAAAQTGGPFNLTWSSIDCGGNTNPSTGGSFAAGGTAGQPDAGRMTGGAFVLVGGFWAVVSPDPCYANCDASTNAPILNVNDFICFQNKFAAGDTYANCDGSTSAPILNVNDFVCFQARFASGCP